MSESLLPPNATALARALESVLALDDRIAGIEAIGPAKLDAITPYLPWLIWEYGLGELLPYLPDSHQAIREGVAWQRLRGTPQALTTALGWRGFGAAALEESGPGIGFAAFQLDPGTVPPPDAVVDIVALARLAAPARARLVRLYHDLDWRAARYDTPMDQRFLYDDWSGVDRDGVRQSFRTVHAHEGTGDDAAGTGGAVIVWGAHHHADALTCYDSAWDGAAEPVAPLPAVISVQSWYGPDPTAPSPTMAGWTIAKAMAADGVAYDSLNGLYDGYAILVSDAPSPRYDVARYDTAKAWRWQAAGDRQVDAYGGTFAPPPDADAPPPALVIVTAIHFTATASAQRYDVADPDAGDASSIVTDTLYGHNPMVPAVPWGAGPWLAQGWGYTSGGLQMEVLS